MCTIIYALVLILGVTLMMGLLNRIARARARADLELFIGEDLAGSHLVAYRCNGDPFLGKVGIPNQLCFYRFAAPFAVFVIYFGQPFERNSNLIALALWVSAIITDPIDGWLARRRRETSNFGRWFDPVADKAVQYLPLAGLIVYFARVELMVSPVFVGFLTVVLIIRDVVLLAIWIVTRHRQGPHWTSKVRAVAIALTVAMMAVIAAGAPNVLWVGFSGAAFLAAVFSLVSLVVETKRLTTR